MCEAARLIVVEPISWNDSDAPPLQPSFHYQKKLTQSSDKPTQLVLPQQDKEAQWEHKKGGPFGPWAGSAQRCTLVRRVTSAQPPDMLSQHTTQYRSVHERSKGPCLHVQMEVSCHFLDKITGLQPPHTDLLTPAAVVKIRRRRECLPELKTSLPRSKHVGEHCFLLRCITHFLTSEMMRGTSNAYC